MFQTSDVMLLLLSHDIMITLSAAHYQALLQNAVHGLLIFII
jgi:hypothetical protein